MQAIIITEGLADLKALSLIQSLPAVALSGQQATPKTP
jgi:hypothetical protein